MAKSAKQKQKILYVAKFFLEKTDENNEKTVADIIEYLAEWDISAERKSIYDDINTLIDFGFDIIKSEETRGGYFLASRDFELAEVKILVDLVTSSKFITENKSRELIGKLENLVSEGEARTLRRQVVVADRNKASNENIYYSVDVIHQAIARNVKIRYQYFVWDVDKSKKLRKDGAFYEVSPWLLTWDDENYYLVAYDDAAGMMKHYRVDKMLKIELTDKIRKGRAAYDKIDIASYTRRTFGMFDGTPRTVQLLCENGMTGVIIDRFGSDVSLRKYDEEHVLAHMEVKVSPQFYGWLSGFGTRIRLIAPEDVAGDYRKYLEEILEQYRSGKEA